MEFEGFSHFTEDYSARTMVFPETLLSPMSMREYPPPLAVKALRRLAVVNPPQRIMELDSSNTRLPVELPTQELRNDLVRMPEEPFVFPALKEYPIFTPPLACPPPFIFPVHTNPDCQAPVAKVTDLLQEVLGIMNTVMSEQGRVEEESEILAELVELVAIMQQEAEALVEMVDLVEEYVDEVKAIVELEEWVQELESIRSPSPAPWPRMPMTPITSTTFHEREFSDVSMGGGTDSGLGSYDEMDDGFRGSSEIWQEDLDRDPAIHDPTIHYQDGKQYIEVEKAVTEPVIKVSLSRTA